MKIVNASATYVDPTGKHPYEVIEAAGRTCYKSEDKITQESAVDFVKGLVQRKHHAMLEHAHIIMKTSAAIGTLLNDALDIDLIEGNRALPFASVIRLSIIDDVAYASGNFRAWLDLVEEYGAMSNVDVFANVLHQAYPEIFKEVNVVDLQDRIELLFEDSEFDVIYVEPKILTQAEFIKDITDLILNNDNLEDDVTLNDEIMKHVTHSVRFVCDRGITHELVRHRPASFGMESTRFCNYSRDKFNHELQFISPFFWEAEEGFADTAERKKNYDAWIAVCENIEKAYMNMVDNGVPAQQARAILPNSIKSEIVVTATELEWQHIMNLRYHATTGKPHPQMLQVMNMIVPELVEHSEGRLK